MEYAWEPEKYNLWFEIHTAGYKMIGHNVHKQEKWWILAIKLHSHGDDHIHFNMLFYLLLWLNLV